MWYIIIGFVIILACWFINKTAKSHNKLREVEVANNRLLEEERQKEKIRIKEAQELAQKEKYGEQSDCLKFIGMSIRVYNSSRTILINDNDYSFDEITGCSVREEKTIIPGQTTTTYTTKTNGGSMIGRALVGAVVAGPVGAAIGGVTAKKETIQHTSSTPDTIKYKYYVTIGINKKGCQDIVYDTNFKDRAEKVKLIINGLVSNTYLISDNHSQTNE